MRIGARVAAGMCALGMMLGTATVIAGQADAAPRGCSIYDYRHGVSASCPPGKRYVVEIDCFGIGRSTGETGGVRVFYRRTSAPADRTGFAAVNCGEGSYIGIGVVTNSWIR
ncbi:hypothetical protein VZC37_07505 [Gordonia sp. LSe1-13]|uniref:Secreted protein n=1 Tax=Gordonia sesuvii TaxID=3116777 RepID=A0ABU7MAU2_9ACTN|nr:hypothetical protein [Gordonia sp. LSe1-13]